MLAVLSLLAERVLLQKLHRDLPLHPKLQRAKHGADAAFANRVLQQVASVEHVTGAWSRARWTQGPIRSLERQRRKNPAWRE